MNLKQLQAEWRDFADPKLHEAHCFRIASDALTPFILQQEKDRVLIHDLYEALLSHGPAHPEWKICEQARSRLKEMEE